MLLRKEKLSGYNQRRQMRESAEKNSFDDDISLFDYDDEYEDASEGDMEETEFTGIDKQNLLTNMRTILSKLTKIEERLANIEKALNTSSQKVTVTTEQPAVELKEGYSVISMGDSLDPQIDSMLRAPKNATPKEGSMLAEIQTVIAQQGFADDPQASGSQGNAVDNVCTLASSTYDDEIPDVDVE